MTKIGRYVRQHHLALLALFVALGGTAYAALGTNSVKSRHIAPKQVKRSDLAPNAVNSSRVANGSLRAGDFGAGPASPGRRPDPPGPRRDRRHRQCRQSRRACFAELAFDARRCVPVVAAGTPGRPRASPSPRRRRERRSSRAFGVLQLQSSMPTTTPSASPPAPAPPMPSTAVVTYAGRRAELPPIHGLTQEGFAASAARSLSRRGCRRPSGLSSGGKPGPRQPTCSGSLVIEAIF